MTIKSCEIERVKEALNILIYFDCLDIDCKECILNTTTGRCLSNEAVTAFINLKKILEANEK